MKKNLLVLLFAFTSALANAQNCVPDPQYTTGGIYPDSITNLPPACLDEVYNVIVTAVVPHDTTANTPFGPATVTIDSINIKKTNNVFQVNGLPTNFTFACEPPSCGFPGGASPGTTKSGCLLITGFPASGGTISTGDTFNLQVDLVAYVSGVPVINTYTLDDGSEDVNYYYIAVRANGQCNSGVIDKSEKTFSVKQNTPNPFRKNTNITFTNNKNGKVTFTVYNMIGEAVHSEVLFSKENFQNVILFDGKNLPSGLYSYSLNNGEKTISKRMILMEN